MKFYIIFYIIWMQLLIANVLGVSYYSITAPGTLKSNRKYTVAITLDHAEEQCIIRVSIEGMFFNASHDVYLEAYETKLIDFYPPKLYKGEHKLIAEGIKGLIFRNETELLTISYSGPKIYIQTDKAAYKPGDLIQFWVVILDEHTRPLNISEPIRVDILDKQSNRVKQFKDITLVKGVFMGKFQLSQRPLPGTWKIRVKITGKYDSVKMKGFRVGKIILPKFSVHIKAAEVMAYDDKLKALIYGKYTFGRYVEGIANIQLWDITTERTLLQESHVVIKSVIPFETSLENFQNHTTTIRTLQLAVRMVDNYSGTLRSNNVLIKVHKSRYAVNIPYTEVEFHNGIPYILKAYVSYHTGAPVLDRETPVILKHGNRTYETFLEDEGVATFKFQYESNEDFTVLYKDAKDYIPDFFKLNKFMFYESETYCKLKLLKKPRFGTPIEIEVSSITDIPYLAYVLVGHGNIIRMQHILMAPLRKSYILHITPSIDMVPDAYLFVYYIDNGIVRSNEIKISLNNELENKISIVAPKEVTPGQTITLDLKAEPSSYISILAVDISVNLYDPGYNLDREKILSDLKNDKSYAKLNSPPMFYPGIVSGLIIMTNAYFPLFSNTSLVDADKTRSVTYQYRTEFPETWIFKSLEVNSSTTQLTFKVPDTITTWRITAFSNNDVIGFGIVDKPVDILSRKSFFITTNLPYSVKLGEIIDLPVTVFNYLSKSVKSEITLYNDKNEFKFIEESAVNEVLEQCKLANVKSDSFEKVTFKIKPTKIGHITLRLTALTDSDRDAIIQKLKVEAGGVINSYNDARYLKAESNTTMTTRFLIDFPTNIVSDSEYVKLEIGGNYLKPSLENLQQLVKKPTGCGEQNMVNFAPSILILHLLKSIGLYTESDAFVIKLKSFIEIGYQQELAYRHYSGGFSVFGQTYDAEESTWLTAYVIRFFIKASQYSTIDNNIVETGLTYLSNQQLPDGSFPYTGYLFEPAQKNEFGMTAFVLLTFLESKKYSKKYSTTISNALQFLNTHIDNIEDIYSLSIIATALKAAKSKEATKVLEKLNQVSKSDSNGNKWWSLNKVNNENDVEITAYILMALLDTPGDYTNITKWLIGQRNEFGGFASTHDTVVGLQALIKYYEQFQSSNDTRITLKYTANNKMGGIVHKGGFEVMADNFEELQIIELPKSTSEVICEINGFGYVFAQLNYQYNTLNESLEHKNIAMMSMQKESINADALVVAPKLKHFLIEPQARVTKSFFLDLEICFMYQSPAEYYHNKTNMVLLEANLPSGFRSNAADSDILKDYDFIERVESKNDDTTIILYFDGLTVNSTECVNINAEKLNDVFDYQPVAIKMYDYYNSSLSETAFYTIN